MVLKYFFGSSGKYCQVLCFLSFLYKIFKRSVKIQIFTESTDRFSLMFFGHESTTDQNRPNVYFQNEEFDTARVEWLHVLQNEVNTNPKAIGDCEFIFFTKISKWVLFKIPFPHAFSKLSLLRY